MDYKSIEWLDDVNAVRMLDQRLLPNEVNYLEFTDAKGVAWAITDMVIRGALAIGAAAAYGLAVELRRHQSEDLDELNQVYKEADQLLRRSRPTAVNLFWALNRMQNVVDSQSVNTGTELGNLVLSEAHAISQQDIECNKQLSLNALELVPQNARVIHHCNTGGLGSVGYGTALGVIRIAHEHGRNISVLVDETRPRLQGARLTTWELQQLGIPHKLIVDGASGFYMRQGDVDFCVVGCDRVAANGDTANKIGTYNLALVAHAHNIPFYVAGPTSTIDMSTKTGNEIYIEQRDTTEVTRVGDEQIAPEGTDVGNPAFDITPADYITAIITERGIVRPPYGENLQVLFERKL